MSSLREALRAFHEDEEGMEALEVVMIIAIAAIVLLAIVKLWPTIKAWFTGAVNKVTEMEE